MGGPRHPDIEPRPGAADLKVLVVDDHPEHGADREVLEGELGAHERERADLAPEVDREGVLWIDGRGGRVTR